MPLPIVGLTADTTWITTNRSDPKRCCVKRSKAKELLWSKRARGGGERQNRQALASACNIQDLSLFQTLEFRGRRKKRGTGDSRSLENAHPRACQPLPNPYVLQLPPHGNFHWVQRPGCQTPFHKEPVPSWVRASVSCTRVPEPERNRVAEARDRNTPRRLPLVPGPQDLSPSPSPRPPPAPPPRHVTGALEPRGGAPRRRAGELRPSSQWPPRRCSN